MISTGQAAIQILHSMPDAVMALDRAGHYVYLNPAAERLTDRGVKSCWAGRCGRFPLIPSEQFERACRRAVDERVIIHLEEYYPSSTSEASLAN